MADADIIDNKTLVFAGAANPIHARYCLQQAVRNDDLDEIHYLLHRSIEPGEQHVVDNDDTGIAEDAFILYIERQLKTLDAGFVFRVVRVGLQVNLVIMAA